MEIGYQVSGIDEFRYGNLLRFVSSVLITQPDHLVQEFACLLAIDFRVYYPRNFIFGFPINYNWSRGQLCSLREGIGCGRFEHGYIKNWMNRVHGLWKTESEQ